ncbi:MAG: DinB family protein [Gemmatimonadales bacterium]
MHPHVRAVTDILERTPAILRIWLHDLPEPWTTATEGGDTWSAFDVVGHLIHGERTDWMPRAHIILQHGPDRPFEPFDRFAQFETSRGRTLAELLGEFEELRASNLGHLASLAITDDMLTREGTHPEFGRVTLRQLLATWATHDLSHLAQIARVMAKRMGDEVGPWRSYLGVLGH